jgi:hypothetical protein
MKPQDGVWGRRPQRVEGSALALLFALLLPPAAALAGDDTDVNLIPPSLAAPQAPQPEQTTGAGGNPRIYIENDVTAAAIRGGLPVQPPQPSQNWQERVFLDARGSFSFTDSLQAVYSGRLNAQAENDIENPGPHTVRLDSRELYAAWQLVSGAYIDVGRVNIKNGVAYGYNPTDFFAARAVVDPNSLDPQVLREDRLGTGLVEGQYLWSGGSATLAYAPRLAAPAPLRSTGQLPALNPLFDQTNTSDRWLATVTAKVAEDMAPELLLYHAAGETRVGANLAQSFGRATVLYAEWSGGMEAELPAQVLDFAVASGMVSPQTASAVGVDNHQSFRNDLAIGGSYTTANKVTLVVEYDYHQAGVTSAQLRGYYDAAASGNALAGQAMWLLRGYAGDQQQPLGRHEGFARVSCNDAFVRDLELDAFAMVSLQDGSALGQVSATYNISDWWQVGALATATFGGRRSEYGGQATATSVIAKLARYF